MNSKNGVLLHYHNQLQDLNANSVWAFLNKQKIKQFYSNNQIKLTAILNKISILQHDMFEHDEKDEIVFSEDKPVLKEGKTMDEYNERYTELMNEDCVIK